MEIEKESGWNLHPIGGETGKAYMGVRNEEKVFLKKIWKKMPEKRQKIFP